MLDELKDIAKRAGKLLKMRFLEVSLGSAVDVSEKAKSDFVTSVDVEVEGFVRELVADRLGIPVVGEETGSEGGDLDAYILVDPIDGTRNFMRGNPHFAVNIAYLEKGDVVCGVTYDPMKNEMFFAQKARGAFLNGERVKVSSTELMDRAIVAIGLPYRGKAHVDFLVSLYRRLFLEGSATRHTGSAALDLAYVACGRYDAFVEIYLSPWDVASGVLMVKEAGGKVAPLIRKNPLDGWLIASSPSVFERVKALVRDCGIDL
ncbi:MAG: inositol monophosphatase [Deferribacteres bacterium]|nr:inositol monophosphatase [Deferribacteres bacterium]